LLNRIYHYCRTTINYRLSVPHSFTSIMRHNNFLLVPLAKPPIRQKHFISFASHQKPEAG
ncbi:hypothetical protein RvY_00887, partial [Ramazzottius varieornatus]